MKTLLKMLPTGEQTTPRERGTVLEPCPFCGSKGFLGAEATYSHNLKPGEMDYAIRCGSCDALGPWGATAYLAATQWNKREKPRSAHKGRPGIATITAVSCVLLAFLAPLRAMDLEDTVPAWLTLDYDESYLFLGPEPLQVDDWSAFPTVPPRSIGHRLWFYNSKTEPWMGDPTITKGEAKPAAQIVDDNPGVLDDPACRGLVVAQLKSQNQQLKDWIVEFNHTSITPDGLGGANAYHITSRVTGEVWEIVVALHSEQVKVK
jgi:hypothetical protein